MKVGFVRPTSLDGQRKHADAMAVNDKSQKSTHRRDESFARSRDLSARQMQTRRRHGGQRQEPPNEIAVMEAALARLPSGWRTESCIRVGGVVSAAGGVDFSPAKNRRSSGVS